MGEPIKLRVSQIEKSFPGVKALNKIDFSVKKGTVHVLCGENGAGKSTLMKIINGVYQPDAGEIYLDGKLVKISSPLQARQLGISMIFQELNYVAEMSVEENLFLGRLPVNRLGKVNWKEVTRQTLQLLQAEQLPYDPKTLLKDLTVSDIQMLEIMKAVSNQAELIIMDEPTSAITQKEVDRLFAKIRELKARGVSIIYISHKLDEIFQIADEITVFRDGTVVDSRPKEELDIETVISLMVGGYVPEGEGGDRGGNSPSRWTISQRGISRCQLLCTERRNHWFRGADGSGTDRGDAIPVWSRSVNLRDDPD
ncbi:ATP-binding cassette domain-containing protein [Paenibacillus barengoltzii]|uniref:ATP-binding cassette domain-containing protein n=1 Tax=Paenibacillus barengoltzii TaxID=343517 RepID=UPI002FDA8450